jgi:hypothetical protein
VVSPLIEDLLILTIVVSLGAWAFSSWKRARRGEIVPPRCPECEGLVARVDPRCRHCGARLRD